MSSSLFGLRPVYVTGIGLTTPLGHAWADFRDQVTAGASSVKRHEFAFGDKVQLSAPASLVEDFEIEEALPNSKASSLDRNAVFALHAGRTAVDFAGISPHEIEEICIGVGAGGLSALETGYLRLSDGDTRIAPLTIPKSMSNSPASAISIDMGVQAPSYCLSAACSSSNQALISAAQKIAFGQREIVLVGGVEASATLGHVMAWHRMRVMSQDACRPFCKTRSGMVLGEGAAFFIVESEASAHRRGAKPIAKIAGVSESSDARSMTTPDEASIASAMKAALESAGLEPSDIDYVNAHGTGTKMNDKTEAAAIRTVFGDATDALPVSSTKGLHGHLLGGAGAIEFAACIAAIEMNTPPPNGALIEPDPEIDLLLANFGDRDIRNVMSSSFAFGGHNAILIVSRV